MTERVECPACGRKVRPGIECRGHLCPWAHEARFGTIVISRPLRRRFIA